MLERIGVRSVDDLLTAIPQDARHPRLGLAPGLSEMEVQSQLERLAAMNRTAGSGPFFIGGADPTPPIPPAAPLPPLPAATPPPPTPPPPLGRLGPRPPATACHPRLPP